MVYIRTHPLCPLQLPAHKRTATWSLVGGTVWYIIPTSVKVQLVTYTERVKDLVQQDVAGKEDPESDQESSGDEEEEDDEGLLEYCICKLQSSACSIS